MASLSPHPASGLVATWPISFGCLQAWLWKPRAPAWRRLLGARLQRELGLPCQLCENSEERYFV